MDLASAVRGTPPRLLLAQNADDAYPPDRLELLAALPLPLSGPAVHVAVLADADQGVHVVPLVVDGGWARPARSGDGVGVGVVDLVRSGAPTGPFQVRRCDPDRLALEGALNEQVIASTTDLQRWLVADELVVTVRRRPEVFSSAPVDGVAHLLAAGFSGLHHDHGDVVLVVGEAERAGAVDFDAGWVGPILHVTAAATGARLLRDELTGALLSDVRGGDTPKAVALAEGLGELLARFHLALATPTSDSTEPVAVAGPGLVASWRRRTADSVASASVLADSGPAQRLRSGRDQVKDAVRSLDAGNGSAVLLGAALPGLEAVLLDTGGSMVFSPEVFTASVDGHPAAQDLAVVLRGIGHLAWTTHRRLVSAGDPVAVEQVADWENGVRQTLVDAYVRGLHAGGRPDLFVAQLLTAFEVQAECELVVRAARTLSTSMAVSDAALAALLAP
ncbi:MAG: hypothetical protein WAN48_02220 [Actinomycetes bacterium]